MLHKLDADKTEVVNHKKNERLQKFKEQFDFITKFELKQVAVDSDLYLICVKDNAIESVLNLLDKLKVNKPVLVCSGTFDISKRKANIGILYPLQSFRAGSKIKWKETPLFIEGNNDITLQAARKLAYLFSKTIIESNYKQRLSFHLAAVFANNFTNSFLVIAERLIKEANSKQNLEILKPILKQTLKSALDLGPLNSQTGPAARNDKGTMEKHEELLKGKKTLLNIYKEMSNLIAEQQKGHA